jgi:glycosyltransferase involved in cell wall biosynthesis
MKVAIVTPSIGQDSLTKCLLSVQNQSYEDIVHYVFIDGEEHGCNIRNQLDLRTGSGTLKPFEDKNVPIKTVTLEENIGKGWYGHRVYAACSFLVNADAICYLDEDNWFEPDHVKKLVEKLKNGNQWAYSLRKIYDQKGNFICEDNCESLGIWPVYFNDQTHHIDTSSFIIDRNVATHIGHTWYGQWGADRQFFHNLKQNFPNFECTNKHTLCYRLDNNTGKGESNPNSVNKDFFIKGNKMQKEKYDTIHFPWKKETTMVARVAPGISIVE